MMLGVGKAESGSEIGRGDDKVRNGDNKAENNGEVGCGYSRVRRRDPERGRRG